MAARKCLLGWVLCALVCAQALGFMHRVVHLPHAAGVDVHAPGEPRPPGWASDLFSGHADDSGCRLFDAIGHGMPLPSLPAALPVVAAAEPVRCATTAFLARATAAFHARAPPLSP